jgi:hypothetical protein
VSIAQLRSVVAGLVIAVVLLVCRAGAQTQPPLAACGPETTQFTTSHGEVGDAAPPESPEKATVYVIEIYNLADKGRFARPTIRVGMDGSWIGATQGFSYLRFPAEAGTRHLCVRWQSVFGRLSQQVALLNFDAEAGKTYYLRVPIAVEGNSGAISIDLQQVSEDEGRFLVSEAARSVSKVK